MAEPGVVILHDALLQHLYLGAFSENRYVEEYVHNYGEWERSFAVELWRERAGSGMDIRYFERPMLKRVGERSLAVVVHNAAAAKVVRAHAPNANIVEIPHLFDCPRWPQAEDRTQVRMSWGIGEDAFVFGVFGYLRESKRLIPILKCFDRLHRDRPAAKLLIAGSFASSDLMSAVEPWLAHPGILRTGHLAEPDFWRAADAIDCCLNLRHPGAGETSGIGVRLMGIGKPVFFTGGPEIGGIPPDACVRVSPGLEESVELFDYMKLVVDRRSIGSAIGERAAAHVRYHHSLDRVAEQYWEILCACCAFAR